MGVRIAGEFFAFRELRLDTNSKHVRLLSQKAEPNNFDGTKHQHPTSETTIMQLASSFPPLFSFLPEHLRVVPLWFLVLTTTVATFFVWLFHWPAKKVKLHPMRASPFRPESVPKKIDTIVIGACKRRRTSIEILVRYLRFGILDGMSSHPSFSFSWFVLHRSGSGSGGIACANLLAQSGQRVLILEQHTRTGGCTHSFREEGCEWDTGLHYTSRAMGLKTHRPGALMHFMTKGLQQWTPLQDRKSTYCMMDSLAALFPHFLTPAVFILQQLTTKWCSPKTPMSRKVCPTARHIPLFADPNRPSTRCWRALIPKTSSSALQLWPTWICVTTSTVVLRPWESLAFSLHSCSFWYGLASTVS